MKRVGLFIFIIGILLDIGAFLLSNADQLNFVYSIVAPSYVRGESAIKKILDTRELMPGSTEFEICKDLYFESIKHDNPEYDLTGITIVRIYRPPRVEQVFSIKKGTYGKRPLYVYLSNGLKYESSIEALEKKVDRLKKSRVLESATFIFVLGTILTIIGFTLGFLKSKNA